MTTGAWTVADMFKEMEEHAAFQASLSPRDPRHDLMFEISEGYALIYWGGYEYAVDLSEIQRPEDLVWRAYHIGKKTWPMMTPTRLVKLMAVISNEKGWKPFERVQHPSEAPRPDHSKIGERAKMSAQIRYAVIKRDGYRCRCCGFAVQDGAHLHVDHIIPVSKGGLTKMANLQTLCTVCNLGKGAA